MADPINLFESVQQLDEGAKNMPKSQVVKEYEDLDKL